MKYNHFARVCKSLSHSQKVSVNAHSVTAEAGCNNNTDVGSSESVSSSESDFFVDAVDSVCTDTGQNQAFIYATIGPSRKNVKKDVKFKSQVNILPLKYYQALALKGPFMKTQSQLSAYSGDAHSKHLTGPTKNCILSLCSTWSILTIHPR